MISKEEFVSKVIFLGNQRQGDSLYELYDIIRKALYGDCLSDTAYHTKVHVTTLRNWREGKVAMPRTANLIKVANHLGYKIYWRKV